MKIRSSKDETINNKDFSNAYEFKQAKKQAIKQCNALKIERKNKRNINFN